MSETQAPVALSSPNILQRMREVMQRVERMYRGSYNPHHRFQFASHDAVTEALRRHYVSVGIIRHVTVSETVFVETTHGIVARVHLVVRWINVDDPKDDLVACIDSASQPGGKGGPTPQQIGSAISTGVKILELKNFALVGDDEPDTDGLARQHAPVEQQAPVAAPQQTLCQYYLAGFGNVTSAEQLSALMVEVAGKRGEFSADEIKELTAAWQDTKARLGEGH